MHEFSAFIQKPIFALVVLTVLLSFSACGDNNPRSVGDAFLEAVSHGDFVKAKTYVTTKSLPALDMLAQNSAGKPAATSTIKFVDINVINDQATYAYNDDGVEKYLTLVQENGEWKVQLSKN